MLGIEIESHFRRRAICVMCNHHAGDNSCLRNRKISYLDYVHGIVFYSHFQRCEDSCEETNKNGHCKYYSPKHSPVPDCPNPPPPPENATRAKNRQLINDMICNVAALHKNLDKLIDIMLKDKNE